MAEAGAVRVEELLRRDFCFVVAMNKRFPAFHVPSWYWIPQGMSMEEFKQKRCRLTRDRGVYEGVGIAGASSYRFTVPVTGDWHASITFASKGDKDEHVVVVVDNEDELFERLETFLALECMEKIDA
jgi:hypothetical protein